MLSVRFRAAYENAVTNAVGEGIVTPEDLDTAVKASYGFRLSCMGPMTQEDLIGLDTCARVSGNVFKLLSNRTNPSPALLEKVEKGELGIKSGKGFYEYPEPAYQHPDFVAGLRGDQEHP